MSIGHQAIRGAAWTILTSVGGRLIGVFATLALTRFIDPTEYGAVSAVAAVIMTTADEFTRLGVFQYILANPHSGAAVTWHCTVYHLSIGLPVIGLIVLFRRSVVPFFGTSNAVPFIPGMGLVSALDRISTGPERILQRDMRFRPLAIATGVAQFLYAAIAVLLAAMDWGGYSIVWGNIAQWSVTALWLILLVRWQDWLKPAPLRKDTTKKIFAFAIPLSVGYTAHAFARMWDKLLMARFFGSGVAGRYSMAYSLADIPATHVGEHIGDVLLPSFARMDDEYREDALVRTAGLLALVMFPMAVGLGAVAPSLTTAIFNPTWASMWPMITILSALSVVRPIGWIIGSFLMSTNNTKMTSALEVAKVVVLLVSIYSLSHLGPLWATAAPGVAFGFHALASMWAIKLHKISMSRVGLQMIPPLLACIPMALAVVGAHQLFLKIGWFGSGSKLLDVVVLAVEILVGMIVFVPAALVLAPRVSGEFLRLIKTAILNRMGRGTEAEEEGEGDAGDEGEGGAGQPSATDNGLASGQDKESKED